MVALTPRVLKKSIIKSRLSRNSGSSYGSELVLNPETPEFQKIMGSGLSSFGSGITTFGGGLSELSGSGLFPFGSGVCTCGTGTMPFGMGILSSLKGFVDKASSVIRGVVPGSLRRAAVDFGKKKARQMLPQVVGKVKEEIQKQAPGLVTRLTDPLVGKLPPRLQDRASDFVQRGSQFGLNALDKGISSAEQYAMKRLGGRGLTTFGGSLSVPLPVPSSYPVSYSQSQLGFMKQRGEDLQRQRDAGNVPKRLILDQHSRSLLDTIEAEKGYQHAKSTDALEQIGLQRNSSSSEAMGPVLRSRKALVVAKPKKPAARKGRPKGAVSGKGIVYL